MNETRPRSHGPRRWISHAILAALLAIQLLTWAVLFNSDASAEPNRASGAVIDPLMHRAARAVRAWPEPRAAAP